MKIPLKPFDHFVPGKGMLRVTDAEVTVGQYTLGGPIRGHYDLRAIVTLEKAEREISVASGAVQLTADERAACKGDDHALALQILTHAGLQPA